MIKNALVAMGVVVAVLIVLLVAPTAKAATFTHDGNAIRLEGDIERGDANTLQSLITSTGITTLYLNSNGGNALEGYSLGYTINRNGMLTIVGDTDTCLSACAVAFIGGTSKVLSGNLGFHVAWSTQEGTFSEGMKNGQFFGTINAAYLFNMGYSIQLQYIVSQVTDSETFLILNSDDLKLLEMSDGAFTDFVELPENWMYERVADPLRLYLLQGGH
jgi:hypothetical protein